MSELMQVRHQINLSLIKIDYGLFKIYLNFK